MIKRVFLPPLDSKWRLMSDVPITLDMLGYPNEYLTDNLQVGFEHWPSYERGPGFWDKPGVREAANEWRDEKIKDLVFPAGTVIVFDRYHVSHSGREEITIRILGSKDQRISPKKAGGQGKGTSRVYLTLAGLNTFGELEQLE